MEILGDRFLRSRNGLVFDLASGHEVVFRRSTVGAGAEQSAWVDRCTALASVRHPHLVELVDYGLIGVTHRFEALRIPQARRLWPTHDARAGVALRSVVSFLHEHSMSAGRIGWDRLVDLNGRPALEPDHHTGAPWPAAAEGAWKGPERRSLETLVWECRKSKCRLPSAGVSLQSLSVIRHITEVLDEGRPGSWRCLHARAAPGLSLSSLIAVTAREARLRGFVPVSVSVLTRWPGLSDRLADFHLLVLDEVAQGEDPAAGRRDLARFVAALGLLNARPNVVLVVHEDPACSSPALDSPPIGHSIQVAGPWLPVSIQRPGGYSGTSWSVGEEVQSYRVADRRVADRDDAGDGTSAQSPLAATGCDRWFARARGFARKGFIFARLGRHAAAERLLRQAVSALSRRGEQSGAGRAALGLGQLLLERGRTRDAVEAFKTARTLLAPLDQGRDAVRAAAFIGLAWTDEGRLVEAEAALRASRIAAEQIGDRDGCALVQLALARCLLWQGRTGEALALVEACGDLPIHQRSAALRLPARLALAEGRLPAAGASAAAALDAAREVGGPRELSSAYAVLAAVQASIGDLGGLRQYVAEGLREARKAHTPLRALRLRATLLEGLVRLNQRQEARLVAAHLARHNLAKLPAVLRARVQLAVANSSADPAHAGAVRRAAEAFVRRSGARALEKVSQETPSMDVIQDLIEVMRICHESEDERVALTRVCAAVRERVRASRCLLQKLRMDPFRVPVIRRGRVRSWPSGLSIPVSRFHLDSTVMVWRPRCRFAMGVGPSGRSPAAGRPTSP